MKLVEVVHQNSKSNQKLGISLPIQYINFLSELHNQYDDFVITKSSTGEIIIIVK